MSVVHIFLIGFMGVGKTKLGKKLSRQLNYSFIDIDEEIISLTKKSINTIFQEEGEDYFRKKESEILREITTHKENMVISVGGGLPCYNDNMELMNKQGITCYLFRPSKELYQRLLNNRSERPLLKDLSVEELEKYIADTLEKRVPYYEKAKITIGRDEQTVEGIIDSLKRKGIILQ